MDFDGDGDKDIVSGSWPGELFCFRRLAGGAYAPGEQITGRDGKAINVGKASAIFAFDWDGDRALDLLIGTISGQVHFVPNEGTNVKPAFGAAIALKAGGTPIGVPHGDAGPTVADWDTDGKPDLLVGAGDGSVQWFRNLGVSKTPELATAVILVPASMRGEKDPPWGMRAKVSTGDWNGDGRLDLLMGDFAMTDESPPAANPNDKPRIEKAQKRYDEALVKYEAAFAKSNLGVLYEELTQVDTPPVDTSNDVAAKERNARREELQAKIAKIEKELRPLTDEFMSSQREVPRRKHTYHGWVWVFLRRPNAAVLAN